jgi:hypothetical protein
MPHRLIAIWLVLATFTASAAPVPALDLAAAHGVASTLQGRPKPHPWLHARPSLSHAVPLVRVSGRSRGRLIALSASRTTPADPAPVLLRSDRSFEPLGTRVQHLEAVVLRI